MGVLYLAREWVGGSSARKIDGASRNRDTKNNLGLKKGRISPPQAEAEGLPTAGRQRRAKISLPPTPFLFCPPLPLHLGAEISFLILNLFYKKGSP